MNISQTSATVQTIAKAVLGIFPASGVVRNADGTFHISDYPTQPSLCANQRFASERFKAQCTGYLITPDLALTAGHCLDDYSSISLVRFGRLTEPGHFGPLGAYERNSQ